MKRSLLYKSTANMDRSEWMSFRQSQSEIGGSDFGTILGLNPYCPAIKLFHQKIGMWPFESEDSIATYRGRVMEDVIAKHYWCFWDPENPDQEAMLKNATAGVVVRKPRNVNYIVKNPKYPWINVNLDRVFKHDQKEAYLEIKTILGFVANQWENGFPPYYITQLIGCMAVCEMNYGELALLKDGTFFEVLPMELNKEIAEATIEKSKEFHDLILKGREIMNSEMPYLEKEAMINIISPEPDGTEASKEYLSERFKAQEAMQTIMGTEDTKKLAKEYLEAHQSIGQYEEKKNLAGNLLKDFMIKNKANVIDFNGPKVSWGKKFTVSPKLLQTDINQQ